jgi:hypothetical protein
MSRNRKPRKPVHPLVRRLLEDYRTRRLLPLVGRCRQCGDGYLVGDTIYGTGQWAWPWLGRLRCPYCGTWQGITAPYSACINGRCKRVVHVHLTSRALQAAIALDALSWRGDDN